MVTIGIVLGVAVGADTACTTCVDGMINTVMISVIMMP
jgi:hypothetical protein